MLAPLSFPLIKGIINNLNKAVPATGILCYVPGNVGYMPDNLVHNKKYKLNLEGETLHVLQSADIICRFVQLGCTACIYWLEQSAVLPAGFIGWTIYRNHQIIGILWFHTCLRIKFKLTLNPLGQGLKGSYFYDPWNYNKVNSSNLKLFVKFAFPSFFQPKVKYGLFKIALNTHVPSIMKSHRKFDRKIIWNQTGCSWLWCINQHWLVKTHSYYEFLCATQYIGLLNCLQCLGICRTF